MSSVIEISHPVQQTRQYWIESSVFRIGDTSCEIHLPEETAVIATVQFRDGRFALWNRTASPIQLGRRQVGPNSVVIWKPSKSLQIGDHKLRLTNNGSPAPSKQPADWKESPSTSRNFPGNDRVPEFMINTVAVLGILIIGFFVLVNGSASPRESHATIIDQLVLADSRGESNAGKIRMTIQKAQLAESRQNPEVAAHFYVQAMHIVRNSRLNDTMEVALVDYLNERLNYLQ